MFDVGRHHKRSAGRDRDHSALILATRITLAHFSVSSAISLPNSAGESGRVVAPSSGRRASILGSLRLAVISLFRRSMMPIGVLRGAPTPNQEKNSKPGTVSLTLGTSGSASNRFGLVTARARSFPLLI